MKVLNSCVTLLHTNDLHSHLEQTVQIAGYIKEVRREVPDNDLLLVDCGDFLDRARPETEGTEAGINRDLLQLIGYDALVPGNNEGLTYSFEHLDAFYSGLSIPVVCANFRPLRRDAVSWLVPSLVIRKGGLNIGLIGLTAPFNDYYSLLGWHASDPIETARLEVTRLRAEVDVLIVLSHLGIRQDERLAGAVDGIDLILGGHTHHLLERPLYVGQTAISAAGKFGSHIGHLELMRHADNGHIVVSGGCVPTDDREPDPAADAMVRSARDRAARRMSRVVAVLDQPLPWQAERESPLANLLAAAVRRSSGADIGLVNAGQLLSGLPAGEVTEAMIHSLCPSPINSCSMKLTGRELLHAMEQSLLPEFYRLEVRGFGFRGKVLGTLCYDGIEAEADLSRPPYQKFHTVRVGGTPLDPDRDYHIGTLDMFTFGVGYVGLKEGREVDYLLPEFIRELLAQALDDRRMVAESRIIRLQVTGSYPPNETY